ncbi:DUF4867 family protein [Desemzia sp. FAM 23991]|uniref:DUF4867 family protein n=1 Tax=Desemzia sp. FAM 23991 TaxID=3259521 RepID=UPI00388A586E
MNFEEIKKKNSDKKIENSTSENFTKYGKILSYDATEIIRFSEKNISIPEEGNIYVPSNKELESFDLVQKIGKDVFGNLAIEAGECAGQNTQLTGVEHHQGSEVTIAVTDVVLVLGLLQDMVGDKYDSTKTEIFFFKKGSVIELYGTTLHYSPCKVMATGFMTVVLLLEGTNKLLLNGFQTNNKQLVKQNKFLIVHPSQVEKIDNGTIPGLMGDLIEIKPLL